MRRIILPINFLLLALFVQVASHPVPSSGSVEKSNSRPFSIQRCEMSLFDVIRRRSGSTGSRKSKKKKPKFSKVKGSGGNENQTETEDDACFPEDAAVEVFGKGQIPMYSLAVGDSVRTSNGQYSQVYMFSHREATGLYDFIEVIADGSDEHSLRLSPGHFVYVDNQLVQARFLKTGQLLETADGRLTQIVSLRYVKRRGLYNPHTMSGDIVVDGIRTSTFTKTVEPVLAESLLVPFRAGFGMLHRDLSFGLLHRSASWRHGLLSFVKALAKGSCTQSGLHKIEL